VAEKKRPQKAARACAAKRAASQWGGKVKASQSSWEKGEKKKMGQGVTDQGPKKGFMFRKGEPRERELGRGGNGQKRIQGGHPVT